MARVIELSNVLESLRVATVPSVADSAVRYGLAAHQESWSLVIDVALAAVERTPGLGGVVFAALAERPDLTRGHATLAVRTRVLAPQLSPLALASAAEVVARVEGDASRDFVLGILDGGDERRAAAVVGALKHLAEGAQILVERLSRSPRPSYPIADVVGVVLDGRTWTRSTLRLVLEVAAEPGYMGGTHGMDVLIDELNAGGHPCACSHDTSDSWAEAVGTECHPVIDASTAGRAAERIERDDDVGALNQLLERVPPDWLTPRDDTASRDDADLAAGILAILSEDRDLRSRLAKTHGYGSCRLVAGCIARIIDEQDGPEGDPADASLYDALSALGSSRSRIRNEESWVARVVSFGDEAVPGLEGLLLSGSLGDADRATEALARIGTEAAAGALVVGMSDDHEHIASAARALEDVPRPVLAPIDRELLDRAVAAADRESADSVLERWREADAEAAILAPPVVGSFEHLAFAEETRDSLMRYLSTNPLPEFVDPVLSLWRTGEAAIGRAARILLSFHGPDDPRLAEVARDLDTMDEKERVRDMVEGRLFLLPLTCRACGALYTYEVRDLRMCAGATERRHGLRPREYLVIGDTIRCKRCGSIGTHEWTTDAERTFAIVSAAQAARAHMEGGEEQARELLRRSAVSPMKFTSTVGDDLPFCELISRLEARVSEAPDEPARRIRLGNAKLTLGRLDEAAAVLSDILARWPDHAEAAYQLGNTFERQERWAEALDAFVRSARSLAPSTPDAGKYAGSLAVSVREMAGASGVIPPTDVLDKLSRLRASAPPTRERPVRSPPRLGRGASLDSEDEDHIGTEDDDFEVVRPVRRQRAPGRNDPCPCGSGKKYKKCCERSQAGPSSPSPPPPSPQGDRARRIAQRLTGRVMSAAKRFLTKDEFRRAFAAWRGVPATSDALVTEDEAEVIRFNEYLLHDWRPDGGATVIERFQQVEGPKLTAEERAQIDAWLTKRRRAWFEVEHIDKSAALTTLKDCIEGGTCVVYDTTLSSRASRGDMFILAVFPVGTRLEISGTATSVRRNLRTAFGAWVRREHESWSAARVAAGRDASWRAFFSERAAEVDREVERLTELPPRVVLSTGESPSPGHAVYEVNNRQAVLTALEATAELVYRGWSKGDSVEGDSYGWVHRKGASALPFERPVGVPGEGEPPRLVVGAYLREQAVDGVPMPGETAEEDIAAVYLGTDRMEVQALSSERVDYVRRTLEECLGTAIREKYVKCEGPKFAEELWGKTRARGGAPQVRPRRDGESRQLEREFFERSADRWVDSGIPALGGKTPRQAVADPQTRGEVEALLRDFEEHERRGPASSRGFAARIRRELGMQ